MTGRGQKLLKFLKDWMLVIGMVLGASSYLTYSAIPALHPYGPAINSFIKFIQPILIFCMLFLTFNKIEPRQLKLRPWMPKVLILQVLFFTGTAAVIIIFPNMTDRIALEAFMLCMICPTATACPVVAGKLGGDIAGVLTYTIIINLAVAVLVPLVLPVVHPMEGLNFISAFWTIIRKIFPMLIMPCLAAWFVRYCIPALHSKILKLTELPFYFFAVSLTLAIVTATHIICINEDSGRALAGICIASLISCILQFWLGKRIGTAEGQRITSGQAMGQKNTVFAMWLGYTFMNPLASVAGGAYSIWHNIFNSWQLYNHRKNGGK